MEIQNERSGHQPDPVTSKNGAALGDLPDNLVFCYSFPLATFHLKGMQEMHRLPLSKARAD